MKTSSVGWGRGALRNIIYTSYVCSVAARNKEIDSTFPITCPNAILEARPVDGSVKPIFRVIPGYFVVGKGGEEEEGTLGCNNGAGLVPRREPRVLVIVANGDRDHPARPSRHR